MLQRAGFDGVSVSNAKDGRTMIERSLAWVRDGSWRVKQAVAVKEN